MPDDPEGLIFTEAAERSWRAYLSEFREQVWPVFEAQGFTFEGAFSCWMLNRVNNNIDGLLVKLDGDV